MRLDETIKAHGSEIVWEVYVGESSYIVWASHGGGKESDCFKFTAGWTDLDIAVEDVHQQIQHHGPKWARVQQRLKQE